MTVQQQIPIRLAYGRSGQFSCELDAAQVAVLHPGPAGCGDIARAIEQALRCPLEMPTLDQALVPDDRIVIALDRDTPCAPELIAGIWRCMAPRGVDASRVTILHPAHIDAIAPQDPRAALPDDVREQIAWAVHDPTDEQSCAYLATTSAGERIYLSNLLIDADFVLPVGVTGFDSLLGYQGTSSVLYPGMSTVDALARSIGQGHAELSPGDIRPLRQLTDEIAWLMGVQFTVQVVCSADGSIVDVVAGDLPSALKRCQDLVDEHWLVRLPERVETVLVAVSRDAGGHGWKQLGRALATARQLVEPNGRVIVLSELDSEPGEGVRLLRDFEDPLDALPYLRRDPPPDLLAATELANAAGWSRLFLLSNLADELVEDLFMLPMSSTSEVARLLETSTSTALIGAAQHTFGIVR